MVVQILHTLLAFSAIANLLLGIIVINRQRRNLAAYTFFLLNISIFIWSIGVLFLMRTSWYFFDGMAMVGGILTISFLGLFLCQISKINNWRLTALRLFFILCGLFFIGSVFVPGALITPGMEIRNHLIFIKDTSGPVQLLFSIFGGISLLIYIYISATLVKKSSATERKDTFLILLAVLISGLISMTTNLFLPTFGYSVFGGIGPISSLIFTVVVTYSIFKQKTFHIKILLSEIIVFIFLAYIGAQVFLAEDLSDFGFKMVSFIITLVLSIILLRSVNNEMRLKAEVEQTYQKQSNFLADIAHKLKTPLTIVRLNNDLAKSSFKDKDYQEAKESIDRSIQAVGRLARMSTNLVTLGKIDFGLSKLEKHQFDLSALISSSVSDFKPLLGSRVLESKIEPGIQFYGDSSRIQEMLYNLLDNAVKFTDPDEGKISVSLSVIPNSIGDPGHGRVLDSRLHGNDKKGRGNDNGGGILLTISDNGSGIKKEDLPHLFNRYYQGEERSGSAGIGLAICKWIVTGHNGKIEIESEKGKGTKLLIIFKK